MILPTSTEKEHEKIFLQDFYSYFEPETTPVNVHSLERDITQNLKQYLALNTYVETLKNMLNNPKIVNNTVVIPDKKALKVIYKNVFKKLVKDMKESVARETNNSNEDLPWEDELKTWEGPDGKINFEFIDRIKRFFKEKQPNHALEILEKSMNKKHLMDLIKLNGMD